MPRNAISTVPVSTARDKPEQLTPANQPGTHSYNVSPDLDGPSTVIRPFDTPPVTDLIRLPDHQFQRVLEDNDQVALQSKNLVSGPTEFFRVDIGDGVKLDGWLIKPKDFDPSKKVPDPSSMYTVNRPRKLWSIGGMSGMGFPSGPGAGGLHRRELRQPRHARAERDASGEKSYTATWEFCRQRSRLWLCKLWNEPGPISIQSCCRLGPQRRRFQHSEPYVPPS